MNFLPIPPFTEYFKMSYAPEGMCYIIDFNIHHHSDEDDEQVLSEGLNLPSDLSPTTTTDKDYEHDRGIAESFRVVGDSED